jgi:hypothetical protein
LPTARSISDHVNQIASKARSEMIPIIVQKLLLGGGALTLDLATSKQEIIAITAHTIDECYDNDGQPMFRLNSNILELVSWDITKRTTKAEIKLFLSTILSDLGFPSNFFNQIHIVTDEGSSVVGLNDHSIQCIAHILNTIAKHITKPYSKRVKYTDELKNYAELFDQLISDVSNFLGRAR